MGPSNEMAAAAKSKLSWLAACLVGWLRPSRPVRICTDLILPHYFITDFFAVVAEPILAKSGIAEMEKSALWERKLPLLDNVVFSGARITLFETFRERMRSYFGISARLKRKSVSSKRIAAM